MLPTASRTRSPSLADRPATPPLDVAITRASIPSSRAVHEGLGAQIAPAPQRKLRERPVVLACGAARPVRRAVPDAASRIVPAPATALGRATAHLGLERADRFVDLCLTGAHDPDDIEAAARTFAARGLAHARTPRRADAARRLVFRALAPRLLNLAPAKNPRLDALVRGLLGGCERVADTRPPTCVPRPIEMLLRALLAIRAPGANEHALGQACWRVAQALAKATPDPDTLCWHLSRLFPMVIAGHPLAEPLQTARFLVDEDNLTLVRSLARALAQGPDAMKAAFLVAVLPPDIHSEVRMALMRTVREAWACASNGPGAGAPSTSDLALMLHTLLTHPTVSPGESLYPLEALAFPENDAEFDEIGRVFTVSQRLAPIERERLVCLLVELDVERYRCGDIPVPSPTEKQLLATAANAPELPLALRGELACRWGGELDEDEEMEELLHACDTKARTGHARAPDMAAAHLGLRLSMRLDPWDLATSLSWPERLLAWQIEQRIAPDGPPPAPAVLAQWLARVRKESDAELRPHLIEEVRQRSLQSVRASELSENAGE
ncbi:hypothetical protein [Ramlibacter rhizophilus]|uniref:Uncharacterized protein n=1 Tax=Ramlibacter rhizophilus TaxID=1781167 RepID=A0A4Z0BGJ3_9BURK|nr:hypothetical protein [Ramlibacter rhizophilus]TFY97254.1 hypothetical protein EZ242_17130 [Ramlibacter rhizophilus]